MTLLSIGAAYGYVRYRLDSIRTLAAPHLSASTPGGTDSAGGLSPENILLIGNETRAGLTSPAEIAAMGSPQKYSGSLSDVIMILHLDPAKRTASILSLPRDLFVPMPAGSPVGPYQKIDAALNDGSKGPDNLIQAITADLGIPINHFVELQFDGFERTVNAIGGMRLDFPEPVYDAYSGLNITTPGCQALNGAQALALVRSRHLQYDPPGDYQPPADWPSDPESDLSRIVRDHTFIKVLISTAESKGLSDPLTLNAFLGAVINQITIDPGLKSQLVALATHYRHLDPAALPELTLPITTVGGATGYYYAGADIGDVDFPVEPADQAVIAQWDASALPAPSPPQVVAVNNLAGTPDLAGRTVAALTSAGLPATVGTNLPVPAPITETLIRYNANSLSQALAVKDHLNGALMLDPDPSLPRGQVDIDAGSTFSVDASPAAGPAASPASPATPSRPPTVGPTPGGQQPSSATDHLTPWDPIPCPA